MNSIASTQEAEARGSPSSLASWSIEFQDSQDYVGRPCLRTDKQTKTQVNYQDKSWAVRRIKMLWRGDAVLSVEGMLEIGSPLLLHSFLGFCPKWITHMKEEVVSELEFTALYLHSSSLSLLLRWRERNWNCPPPFVFEAAFLCVALAVLELAL